MTRKRQLALFGAGLLGLLVIFAVVYRRHSCPTNVVVYAWRLPSGQVFIAEDSQNRRLQEYRRHEQLDKVVAPEPSDFKQILALAIWASHQFPPTQPFPIYPPWNAHVILDWIRAGKTGGYCAQYGLVFGQACQSFGFFPRYVDIASPANAGGHFTTEVYVPSLKQWVVFEPTWGIYYTDEQGRPLDALALHQFAVGQRKGRVIERPRQVHAAGWPQMYYYFRYYLRNNFLTVPAFAKLLPNRQVVFAPDRLAWKDSFTDNEENWHKAVLSADPSDFRFELRSIADPVIECRSPDDLFHVMASNPPFLIRKLLISRNNLLRVVSEDMVHDPSYQPLTKKRARNLL